MDDVISDTEIERLVSMQKTLPDDYESRIVTKTRSGTKDRRAELEVAGEDGTRFFLMVRVSDVNPLDFSAVLAFHRASTNSRFRLRRYNGKSHRHANNVEKQPPFYDFHIHCATERYQKAGRDEETYAEVTGRYGDIHGAVDCLIKDCGFVIPPGARNLFNDLA